MTPLLTERPLSDAEREAVDDEPRPGVWIEGELPGFERGHAAGDGRELTQEQTDDLIAREVWCLAKYPLIHEIEQHWFSHRGMQGSMSIQLGGDVPVAAMAQRGGIHSDPLVRLLAYRAWGERDRRWFENMLDAETVEDKRRRLTQEYFRLGSLGTLNWTQEQYDEIDRQRAKLREQILALPKPSAIG